MYVVLSDMSVTRSGMSYRARACVCDRERERAIKFNNYPFHLQWDGVGGGAFR
jgi:hypothetical protein